MADQVEGTHPGQTDEERAAALKDVAPGTGTASGLEKLRLVEEPKRVEGEDRGSKVPVVGGDQIVADASGNETQKAVGAQAEPADFSASGSLPRGMIGTPGGPVPIGAVAGTPEDAAKRLEEQRKAAAAEMRPATHGGFKRVPRSVIESASAANLRAAAHDRGWDLGGEAGARVTRARFIEKQNEKLGEEEKEEPTAIPPATTES